LALQLKVQHTQTPLLRDLQISPFLFGSMALAPNTNHSHKESEPSREYFLKNNLRASLGFGLSMEFPEFVLEAYYKLAAKSQGLEHGPSCQFNFGLD